MDKLEAAKLALLEIEQAIELAKLEADAGLDDLYPDDDVVDLRGAPGGVAVFNPEVEPPFYLRQQVASRRLLELVKDRQRAELLVAELAAGESPQDPDDPVAENDLFLEEDIITFKAFGKSSDLSRTTIQTRVSEYRVDPEPEWRRVRYPSGGTQPTNCWLRKNPPKLLPKPK